jgi:hypothetical protein
MLAEQSAHFEPIQAIAKELDKVDGFVDAESNTRNFIIEFLQSQNENRTKAETANNVRETTTSIGETGGRTNLIFGGREIKSRRDRLRSKSNGRRD